MENKASYYVVVSVKGHWLMDAILPTLEQATAFMTKGYQLIGIASKKEEAFQLVVDYAVENNLLYYGSWVGKSYFGK